MMKQRVRGDKLFIAVSTEPPTMAYNFNHNSYQTHTLANNFLPHILTTYLIFTTRFCNLPTTIAHVLFSSPLLRQGLPEKKKGKKNTADHQWTFSR